MFTNRCSQPSVNKTHSSKAQMMGLPWYLINVSQITLQNTTVHDQTPWYYHCECCTWALHDTTLILPCFTEYCYGKDHGIATVHGDNYDLHYSTYNDIQITSNRYKGSYLSICILLYRDSICVTLTLSKILFGKKSIMLIFCLFTIFTVILIIEMFLFLVIFYQIIY